MCMLVIVVMSIVDKYVTGPAKINHVASCIKSQFIQLCFIITCNYNGEFTLAK